LKRSGNLSRRSSSRVSESEEKEEDVRSAVGSAVRDEEPGVDIGTL
jgi:hypothetical protein